MGGPFLMNIGDTPDLGEEEGLFLALSFLAFDALVSTLGPRPIYPLVRSCL